MKEYEQAAKFADDARTLYATVGFEGRGFAPPFEVDDVFLAQMIWAFRVCLPEVTLVLSTREGPAFRDGMAGVGINRMSAASRTTVGGYAAPVESGR